MNSVFNKEFDEMYYTRVGRQTQAKAAWNVFADLGSQIKKSFSEKIGVSRANAK